MRHKSFSHGYRVLLATLCLAGLQGVSAKFMNGDVPESSPNRDRIHRVFANMDFGVTVILCELCLDLLADIGAIRQPTCEDDHLWTVLAIFDM